MQFKGKDVTRWLGVLDRYKYVLLVIVVGLVLLLLPREKVQTGERSQVASPQSVETGFDLGALERKMAAALSEIEGAGEVTVLLTVQNSPRKVLAQDGSTTQREGTREESAQTVVVSKGSGAQEAVLIEQVYPDFQGALVISTGGEKPTVRLKLVEAVSALTGLGADQISIFKGK